MTENVATILSIVVSLGGITQIIAGFAVGLWALGIEDSEWLHISKITLLSSALWLLAGTVFRAVAAPEDIGVAADTAICAVVVGTAMCINFALWINPRYKPWKKEVKREKEEAVATLPGDNKRYKILLNGEALAYEIWDKKEAERLKSEGGFFCQRYTDEERKLMKIVEYEKWSADDPLYQRKARG